MTEQEILKRQEDSGNRELYLMLVVIFLHTCGQEAFALARAMSYCVVRKRHRHHSDLINNCLDRRNSCYGCQRDFLTHTFNSASQESCDYTPKTWL